MDLGEWSCQEILIAYYAEDYTTQQKQNEEAVEFTENMIRFNPPQGIRGRGGIQRSFSLKSQRLLILSTPTTSGYSQRIIITENGLRRNIDTNSTSTYYVPQLLHLDRICNEWEKLLDCFIQHLSFIVCLILIIFVFHGLLVTKFEQ
jgi:hypothetical protein